MVIVCGLYLTAKALDSRAETSGDCGDTLQWSFDETKGQLTIAGTEQCSISILRMLFLGLHGETR